MNHCNLYFCLCAFCPVLIILAQQQKNVCFLGLDDDGDLKGNYFHPFLPHISQDGGFSQVSSDCNKQVPSLFCKLQVGTKPPFRETAR